MRIVPILIGMLLAYGLGYTKPAISAEDKEFVDKPSLVKPHSPLAGGADDLGCEEMSSFGKDNKTIKLLEPAQQARVRIVGQLQQQKQQLRLTVRNENGTLQLNAMDICVTGVAERQVSRRAYRVMVNVFPLSTVQNTVPVIRYDGSAIKVDLIRAWGTPM